MVRNNKVQFKPLVSAIVCKKKNAISFAIFLCDISNVFLGQTRGLEKMLICLYFVYTIKSVSYSDGKN